LKRKRKGGGRVVLGLLFKVTLEMIWYIKRTRGLFYLSLPKGFISNQRIKTPNGFIGPRGLTLTRTNEFHWFKLWTNLVFCLRWKSLSCTSGASFCSFTEAVLGVFWRSHTFLIYDPKNAERYSSGTVAPRV
jgi:hypothetical protein